MNSITKVSQITAYDVWDYLNTSETITASDMNYLNNLIGIAKAFISNYTGRTVAELDDFQDFVIVAFVLCQDMYDNRTLYVDKSNLNHVVETILGMHSVNLLPVREVEETT